MQTCAYCRGTVRFTETRVTASASPEDGGTPAVAADVAAQRLRVIESFKQACAQGASAYEALRVAARERLGPLGETDAFARVVFALGADFDVENGTRVLADPLCMGRLIEAYLCAIEDIRRHHRADVSLPFLTATAEGPRHLTRTLDAETIATLAAREPVMPTPTPAKKKGFWPFW